MRALPFLFICLLAACGEVDTRPDVHPEETRQAARMACATAALLERARDDLETLEALAPEADIGAARLAGPGAVLVFSRAYLQHAEIAAGRFMNLDSALQAATREDSARFADRARSFRLTPPEEESLEGNVAMAYRRNMQAILDDADHPCHVR